MCAIDADDGVRYDTQGMKIAPIREDNVYGGMRLSLLAFVGSARLPMPASMPIALTREFAADPVKDKQWRAFKTKAGLQAEGLEQVIGALGVFLRPLIDATAGGGHLDSTWNPTLHRWT